MYIAITHDFILDIPMEWTIERINQFIDQKIEENLNLDYKAAGSLGKSEGCKNEISKDVSSFANADGGIIIYGIQEDSENKHLPGYIDSINRKEFSKEWLEQVIQSNIHPKIDGLKIIPIEVNDIDKAIYVVDLPKSKTAHQARDKRYYKRFNFKSAAMDDYEIKDILNRAKNPEIDLEFEIVREIVEKEINWRDLSTANSWGASAQKEYETKYTLKVYAINNGQLLANYVHAYISIEPMCLVGMDDISRDKVELYEDNTVRDIVDSKPGLSIDGSAPPIYKYGPSRYKPLLPQDCMKVSEYEIREAVLNSEKEISYLVNADNALQREGKIMFKDIDKVF